MGMDTACCLWALFPMWSPQHLPGLPIIFPVPTQQCCVFSWKKIIFSLLFSLTVLTWVQHRGSAASLAGPGTLIPLEELPAPQSRGSAPSVGFQHPILGRVEASGRWRERGWLWQHYFCPPVWNGFLFISACVFSLLGIDTHKMKCSDMGSVRRMLLSQRHGLLTQTLLITTETGTGGHPQGDVAVGLRAPRAAGIFGVPEPEGLLGVQGCRGGWAARGC